MAYRERIKKFEKIRDYMREFFVYGFHTRSEFHQKSTRSYDNERRRVESWLKDSMSFRYDTSGKRIFISVDSRNIAHNPLYQAFRAKSFTDLDIALHFYILDLLGENDILTFREIANRIYEEYLSEFEIKMLPDEATIRNKLKEYVALGLLGCEKKGRDMLYFREKTDISLETWQDAAAFYSEEAPLGVIGSFLLDRYETVPDYFRFKHHYLLNAFDSQIIWELTDCRRERKWAEITVCGRRRKTGSRQQAEEIFRVFPLKIYISTQNGRQYLLAYCNETKRPHIYRLDYICKVKMLEIETNAQIYDSYGEQFCAALWGVSSGNDRNRRLEHVELTIHIEDDEKFILNRLEREKRQGEVVILDAHTCRFTADVYDAQEMVPWFRTFIGRIEKLECSNEKVVQSFYHDFDEMSALYGGGAVGDL